MPGLSPLFWLGDSVPLLKWTTEKKLVPNYSNLSTGGPRQSGAPNLNLNRDQGHVNHFGHVVLLHG